jgi:L-fucose isomerase
MFGRCDLVLPKKIKVGVFSPNDPRSWVREDNIGLVLQHEESLVDALKKEGVIVVRGGEGLPKMDQIAWNTELVRNHIKNIAQEKPDILIINEGTWTFPFDSVDAVKYYMDEVEDIARVVIFSYKDTHVPGLVAGMASGGGLSRIGIPYTLCYGMIDKDPKTLQNLMGRLEFYKKRAGSVDTVKRAIASLRRQKYLALGGMALRMPTTTADIDQWKKLFGITYEALDQSELVVRAQKMVKWAEKPGESEYQLLDNRLKGALEYLWEGKHGKFDLESVRRA